MSLDCFHFKTHTSQLTGIWSSAVRDDKKKKTKAVIIDYSSLLSRIGKIERAES